MEAHVGLFEKEFQRSWAKEHYLGRMTANQEIANMPQCPLRDIAGIHVGEGIDVCMKTSLFNGCPKLCWIIRRRSLHDDEAESTHQSSPI